VDNEHGHPSPRTATPRKALQSTDLGKLTESHSVPSPPPGPAASTPRQRQRVRLPITNAPAIPIPADPLTQSIMRSLLDGRDYELDPQQQVAVFRPRHTHHESQAHIVIAMEPGAQGTWKDVLSALERLGDDVADSFCAVLALALELHGTQALTQPFYLSPDDILQLCQRKPSHRAFLPEQRRAVIEALEVLAWPVVRAAFHFPRRKRLVKVESGILNLLKDSVGVYTYEGVELWQSRQVKIGDWAKLAPPLSAATALMLRQVLSYHSSRERTEKRLGRYLTLQFDVTSETSAPFTCTMGELLGAAGIRPDLKNPRRSRTMVESALERLHADGVIGAYQQIVASVPEAEVEATQALIEESGRGWWQAYAAFEWQFAPPPRRIEQLALPLIASAPSSRVAVGD
jgi:hypothetical protein